MKPFLSLFFLLALLLQAEAQSIRNVGTGSYPVYTLYRASLSPAITPYFEMYATDGNFSFSAIQGAIRQYTVNLSSVLLTNASPFAGSSGSPNHVGGGKTNGGFLYAAVDNYNGCTGSSNSGQIIKYTESTIVFSATFPVPTLPAIAGVAVDTDDSALASIDYCNSTSIVRNDLSTGSSKDVIQLVGTNFSFFQGIAYRNGNYWVSCHETISPNATAIALYNKSGNIVAELRLPELDGTSSFEPEDVDFSSPTQFGISFRNISSGVYSVGYYNIPAGL